jgi:tetratricopeptide (TPR) repeat protein
VSTSFADYLKLYKKSWLRLQQRTPQLLSYEDRALYSTWNISLDHVKQQSELAMKLLQLWAYLDNQDVWLELMQAGRKGSPLWFSELAEDQLSFDAAVRVLCDHALAEADAASKDYSIESQGYSMHSCVHAWTKHVVNERWDDELASLAMICTGLHVPDQSRSHYWVTDRRLVAHVTRCLDFIRRRRIGEHDNVLVPEAIMSLGVHCKRQGRLKEAEEMYKLGLEICEKANVRDTLTIDILNNQGNLFLLLGRLEEAMVSYQQALEKSKETLPHDHPLAFRTINHIGVCLLDQGRLNEAKSMLEQALEGRESTRRPDSLSMLETVHNLAQLHMRQGNVFKAESMFQRALNGREAKLPVNHTLTLETVSDFGTFFDRQGKLPESENMFRRALKGFEQAFGHDHPSTLYAANKLGCLLLRRYKCHQVKNISFRAREEYEQASGPRRTWTFEMISNRDSLHADHGRLDEAEQIFKLALEGFEKVLGPDHTSTLDTVNNLGILYADQGKLDEAEEMYQRALQGYETSFGSNHPRCRSLRRALATLQDRVVT